MCSQLGCHRGAASCDTPVAAQAISATSARVTCTPPRPSASSDVQRRITRNGRGKALHCHRTVTSAVHHLRVWTRDPDNSQRFTTDVRDFADQLNNNSAGLIDYTRRRTPARGRRSSRPKNGNRWPRRSRQHPGSATLAADHSAAGACSRSSHLDGRHQRRPVPGATRPCRAPHGQTSCARISLRSATGTGQGPAKPSRHSPGPPKTTTRTWRSPSTAWSRTPAR